MDFDKNGRIIIPDLVQEDLNKRWGNEEDGN